MRVRCSKAFRNLAVLYYRKRGSASNIVREVRLVKERERERERDRKRERERERERGTDGSNVTLVA